MYYRGFFYGITYRLSCYHCPFAGSSRVGDITIGDFWGLKNTNELPTKVEDGISLLLPCTNKGLMLLKNVDKELYLLERSIDEAIMGNSQLQNPVLYTNRSKIFNLLYPMTSFDNAVLLSIIDQKIAALIKRILKK